MHYRRLASFLMGVWLTGSILVGWVAIQNLHRADVILASPATEARAILQTLGHVKARMFLRYQAAELNREYFSDWELAQIVIGLLLAAILALGTHVSRFILVTCAFMLVLTLFMHFVLTPELSYMGRELDFVPHGTEIRRRFWVLHGLYSGLEVVKLLLGCVVAVYLFVFRVRPRPQVPDPVAAEARM